MLSVAGLGLQLLLETIVSLLQDWVHSRCLNISLRIKDCNVFCCKIWSAVDASIHCFCFSSLGIVMLSVARLGLQSVLETIVF